MRKLREVLFPPFLSVSVVPDFNDVHTAKQATRDFRPRSTPSMAEARPPHMSDIWCTANQRPLCFNCVEPITSTRHVLIGEQVSMDFCLMRPACAMAKAPGNRSLPRGPRFLDDSENPGHHHPTETGLPAPSSRRVQPGVAHPGVAHPALASTWENRVQ